MAFSNARAVVVPPRTRISVAAFADSLKGAVGIGATPLPLEYGDAGEVMGMTEELGTLFVGVCDPEPIAAEEEEPGFDGVTTEEDVDERDLEAMGEGDKSCDLEDGGGLEDLLRRCSGKEAVGVSP